MVKIVVTYVAIKPLKAEHPIGSGIVVEYAPGELIPAEEWGRAAHNLVENGKAAMMAINVYDEDETEGAAEEVAPKAPPRRKRQT